jgi:transposase, IS6 family
MRSRPHPHLRLVPGSAFAGYRFPPEVITLAVRWYLRFGLSYRDGGSARSDGMRDPRSGL